MKVVLAGIIARYPYGGVTWCSLMYLLGLRALGHEVYYIEDTGECIYDPIQNALATDPSYGTHYIHQALEPFGLGDRWSFVNYDGSHHGAPHDQVRRWCGDADLFINLSGGSWFWRDEYAAIPRKVFVDSDPVFTQLALAKGDAWYVNFFRGFDRHFTFGANIGTPACTVPTGGFTWHHTWQPVVSDLWRTDDPPGDRFTTVMTWKIESFTDVDGNKDREFVKFIDLPKRAASRFELAVNGPQQLLREHGWPTVDAMGVSRSLWDYRAFIQRSRAEFGVAKHAYVANRSGWFSDRTECYLAAGRPAVVQDTGWSSHLPSGAGLIGFSTPDEALDAIARVEADYATHAKRAGEIAREHFDAARVLPRFLEESHVADVARPLRIALVAPVAQPVPPPRSGSIETLTALLANGLVARGHDVTLFATAASTTRARLHAVYERGYLEDPTLWPWEMCELFNLAAALEQAASFDVVHYQAEYAPLSLAFSRLSDVPLIHTVHHLPTASEAALWSQYPHAPFIAVSHEQARALAGLKVAGVVHHAVETGAYAFRAEPDDYLLFLGRFTEGKGVLTAIEIARRSDHRLLLAAAENDYYRRHVAPLVDGRRVVYVGEVSQPEKVALLGGARALVYPVQMGESFGLVLAEAAACGTPTAALRCGAVAEIIEDDVTGVAFESVEALVTGLHRVLMLDRARIRERAVLRFGVDRMVDEYAALYAALAARPAVGA